MSRPDGVDSALSSDLDSHLSQGLVVKLYHTWWRLGTEKIYHGRDEQGSDL